MRVVVRLTRRLLRQVFEDLARPHPFAAERVGFLTAHAATLREGVLLLVAEYLTLPDAAYVADVSVGARINATGFRLARQRAYQDRVSILHVHAHDHEGTPGFSGTDAEESGQFMPDFVHVQPSMPHAAIILSRDSAAGRCWLDGRRKPVTIHAFSIVGPGIRKIAYA